MVIVKLLGGLGNQLFQYACGRHLALQNHTELLLDCTAFEDFYKLHKYSLQHFAIQARIATREEIFAVQNFPHTLPRWQRAWKFRVLGQRYHFIAEKQFNFDTTVLQKYNGEVYMEGYWQSEKYFAEITDILRKELQIKTPSTPQDLAIIAQLQDCEAVSLHIRRADYANPDTVKVHGLCSLEYYHAAVAKIATASKNPTFFVFSDDIAWAKENLLLDFPIVFVGHNDADKNYEDLRLMSLCKHHIIANSSFSWWGAWLNPSPTKIVIAPKQWFATTERNYSDVIPPQWIKM